jgi:hypothetical protein
MKTFINSLTFGVGVALIASGLLIGVSTFAPQQVEAARHAVVQITTTVVDTVDPIPTPTPVVPSPIPTPIGTSTPAPTQAPVGPQPFPPAAQIPQTPAPPALGVSPTPIVVPETLVTISVSPCTGANFDVDSGGCKGANPFTVTYTANFQGGFPGIAPQFSWSDGQSGQTIQVTYSNAGTYRIAVKVDETYNSIVYEAGSANSVLITVS